ncbi:unnamed protein product [Nezara viridula]|uniref:Uncharacterized protein n=1 Tax=Nezara viridula TaxID=85310 RepID=A0A9P0HGK0_NEZVI|nr:unnamed protein product [Nezara viridula]
MNGGFGWWSLSPLTINSANPLGRHMSRLFQLPMSIRRVGGEEEGGLGICKLDPRILRRARREVWVNGRPGLARDDLSALDRTASLFPLDLPRLGCSLWRPSFFTVISLR